VYIHPLNDVNASRFVWKLCIRAKCRWKKVQLVQPKVPVTSPKGTKYDIYYGVISEYLIQFRTNLVFGS
jgi:hypothetical protein